MFKNTYLPGYYKTLHRYTHSLFRKKKASISLQSNSNIAEKFKAAVSFSKYSFSGYLQSLRLKKLSQK
jgi:hypothetical protein